MRKLQNLRNSFYVISFHSKMENGRATQRSGRQRQHFLCRRVALCFSPLVVDTSCADPNKKITKKIDVSVQHNADDF